ncbi:MAG: hypothetical protein SVM80_00335 [Halobacteriota archaeon]|nr:hypothetical protein [Halobacteriota archaeon]
MNKVNPEKLKKLSLDELLNRYSLEEIEEHLSIDDILEKFPDPAKDPNGEPGILLSDEIERYVKEFKLIYPFDKKNLKAASYQLTVGDKYALGGIMEELNKKNDKIVIPPFQVAIIKTREIVNIPRFLIGRWNIRVKWAYKGLLWVGGPQVDPGWFGHLFCPIYNLSDEAVIIKKGEKLATIDFAKTTTFKEESKKFPRPPRRKDLDDYDYWLKSALFTEAAQRIDEIEKRTNRFETKLDTSIGIIFTAIAVLVAALSILVSSTQGVEETLPCWAYFTVIFSILALLISIFACSKTRSKNKNGNPNDKNNKLRGMCRRR